MSCRPMLGGFCRSGGALRPGGRWRKFPAMAQASRIDLRVPPAWRKELDELAAEVGLSASDLARLGIRFLLNNPSLLVKVMSGKEKASLNDRR